MLHLRTKLLHLLSINSCKDSRGMRQKTKNGQMKRQKDIKKKESIIIKFYTLGEEAKTIFLQCHGIEYLR